jgi:hypothetical protein
MVTLLGILLTSQNEAAFAPNRTHRARQEVPDPFGKLEPANNRLLLRSARQSPIRIVDPIPITVVPSEQTYPGQPQSTWRHL